MHDMRTSIFCLLAIFLACGESSAQSNYFELFKTEISSLPDAFTIEYEEGDIDKQPSVSVETINSEYGVLKVVKPSISVYSASYQSNGYNLIKSFRSPIQKIGETNHINVSNYKFSYGRFGDQAWMDKGGNMLYLDSKGSTNETTAETWGEVNYYEHKIWSICYLGLPVLDVRSIMWDGTKFHAHTSSGSVSGTVRIDPGDGRVLSLDYSEAGGHSESGAVFYKYSNQSTNCIVPDQFEKHIFSSDNPMDGARNSYKVRILTKKTNSTIMGSSAMLETVYKSRAVMSNSQMYVRENNNLVLGSTNVPSAFQNKQFLVRSVIIAILVITTAIFICLVVAINKKTKNEK